MPRTFQLVALLVALSGCSSPCPGGSACATATLTASAASAAPAPVPSAVASQPAATHQVSRLKGVARYFGQPLAGATVMARLVEASGSLATATTAADGSFTLDLPLTIAPTTLVELVATGQGHTVASVAPVAAFTVLAGEPAVVLDEAQTAALLVLAPRLIAAIQLGTAEAKLAARQALQATAAALGSQGTSLLDARTFDAAIATVLALDGTVLQTQAAHDAVARTIPAAVVDAVKAQADSLAATIRQAVADGRPKPDASLTGPLAIGASTASEVFGNGGGDTGSGATSGGGSSGGGSGGGGGSNGADDTPIPPAANLAIVTVPGAFADSGTSPTATTITP